MQPAGPSQSEPESPVARINFFLPGFNKSELNTIYLPKLCIPSEWVYMVGIAEPYQSYVCTRYGTYSCKI